MNTASINVLKGLVSGALAMIFTAVLVGSINNSVGTQHTERPLIQAAVQVDTTGIADRAA